MRAARTAGRRAGPRRYFWMKCLDWRRLVRIRSVIPAPIRTNARTPAGMIRSEPEKGRTGPSPSGQPGPEQGPPYGPGPGPYGPGDAVPGEPLGDAPGPPGGIGGTENCDGTGDGG